MTNGLVQHITVEESSSIQWVNEKSPKRNILVKVRISSSADPEVEKASEMEMTELLF